jgi:chromosome segregation ATPase
MELLENSAATIGNLRKELEEARSQLATVEAEREDLAQLKKQAKEDAAEVHREGRSIELEKVRWQQQLSDARAELADAKATILKQGDKIRELERGYSLKPNPAESALRLEIGNLQAELEAYKQQQPAPTIELPDAADLLNQLKARRRKSRADLADVELLLDLFCDGCDR